MTLVFTSYSPSSWLFQVLIALLNLSRVNHAEIYMNTIGSRCMVKLGHLFTGSSQVICGLPCIDQVWHYKPWDFFDTCPEGLPWNCTENTVIFTRNMSAPHRLILIYRESGHSSTEAICLRLLKLTSDLESRGLGTRLNQINRYDRRIMLFSSFSSF